MVDNERFLGKVSANRSFEVHLFIDLKYRGQVSFLYFSNKNNKGTSKKNNEIGNYNLTYSSDLFSVFQKVKGDFLFFRGSRFQFLYSRSLVTFLLVRVHMA